MKTASNQLLVIFGASGDLTGRKLLPSLYELHVRGLLPERFCILGAARTEYTDDEYRAFEKVHIRESLKNKEVDDVELDSFLRRVFYLAFDSTNSAGYHKLKDRIHQLRQEQQLPDKIIYYLATPPVMYELIPTCLKENGMNVAGSEDGWRRVIVEKPFGTSLESAERLNKHLIHIFDEKEIYRIDHYLGKETVQNILVLDPEPIRDEIVKVFRALRPYKTHDMDNLIVRGQYDGYREEKNVAPDSTTETYVAMKMFIDNWRWSDVPFYIFTGKKLPEKSSEIVVNFKSTPHQLFVGQCSGGSCNKLIIRIQPDESITLKFGLKMPGAGFTVKQVGMDFRYDSLSKNYLPDAYERLLLDAMLGDSTLYARSDALEASWRLIDPILHHWKEEGAKNLFFYASGEDGPIEKAKLGMTPKDCPCQSCQ